MKGMHRDDRGLPGGPRRLARVERAEDRRPAVHGRHVMRVLRAGAGGRHGDEEYKSEEQILHGSAGAMKVPGTKRGQLRS